MTAHRTGSRRGFLRTGIAGAIAAALPRVAQARTHPPAERVLVIHLAGGARSSAAFMASRSPRFNPWGILEGATLPIGRVLDPFANERHRSGPSLRDHALGEIRLPRLGEITSEFSIVGTWDPERGDHRRSEQVSLTGGTDERSPGLLVRIAGGRAEAGVGRDRLPGVAIGGAGAIGRAPEGTERGIALELVDGSSVGHAHDDSLGQVRARSGGAYVSTRPAIDLDADLLARLSPVRRAGVARLNRMRRLRRSLAEQLADPILRPMDHGAAERGELRHGGRTAPLTNARLQAILDAATGSRRRSSQLSVDAAVAFRFLQLGSPAVAIVLDGFDMHSGERERAEAVYGRVGGLWTALWFLLSHVPDPSGRGSMLDRTLVVTTSEFGRDPGHPRTGFNGGGGSDHGSSPACYYVAHAVMGAGVPGGRAIADVDTETYDARSSPQRIQPVRLLATICAAVGVNLEDPTWGFPGEHPIELWGR